VQRNPLPDHRRANPSGKKASTLSRTVYLHFPVPKSRGQNVKR
jgi:hypothetical protein